MAEIEESKLIAGVRFVHLAHFGDERGRFSETFRTSWFPERSWEKIQCNRSESRAGVLRGLHYHFHQVDYWHLISGRIQVGLADIRRSSPTRGKVEMVELHGESGIGILIPVGVAHGFLTLEDAVLTYVVDNFYDSSDEMGVAWNDEELSLAWQNRDPVLSDRDRANPRWAEIKETLLP